MDNCVFKRLQEKIFFKSHDCTSVPHFETPFVIEIWILPIDSLVKT